MEEKRTQSARFGHLFWMFIVLLALSVGLVAGYRISEHWLRVENDELHYELEGTTKQRNHLWRTLYPNGPPPPIKQGLCCNDENSYQAPQLPTGGLLFARVE